MKKIMRMLEPRTVKAIVIRAALFLGLITLGNLLFLPLIEPLQTQPVLHALVHAVLVGGPFVGFFFVIMMHQARLIRRLSHRSRKDGLTGLNNRNSFLTVAANQLENSTGGVVLLLDADCFKQVNDVHGHQSGDDCLKAIAKMLKRNLRHNDIVGRIGGEEFAIFLSYTTIRQAKMIAERLTKPIPFKSATTAERLTITMSVGAAEVQPNLSLADLLARADQCLYQAKDLGRARLVVWGELPENNPMAVAG